MQALHFKGLARVFFFYHADHNFSSSDFLLPFLSIPVMMSLPSTTHNQEKNDAYSARTTEQLQTIPKQPAKTARRKGCVNSFTLL